MLQIHFNALGKITSIFKWLTSELQKPKYWPQCLHALYTTKSIRHHVYCHNDISIFITIVYQLS